MLQADGKIPIRKPFPLCIPRCLTSACQCRRSSQISWLGNAQAQGIACWSRGACPKQKHKRLQFRESGGALQSQFNMFRCSNNGPYHMLQALQDRYLRCSIMAPWTKGITSLLSVPAASRWAFSLRPTSSCLVENSVSLLPASRSLLCLLCLQGLRELMLRPQHVRLQRESCRSHCTESNSEIRLK